MFVKVTRAKGFHYAQLVESFRDDNGQPRQRNVMTLGRIDENGGQVERLLQSLLKARGLALDMTRGKPCRLFSTDTPHQICDNFAAKRSLPESNSRSG